MLTAAIPHLVQSAWPKSGRRLWIGAISFEQRAKRSLEVALAETNIDTVLLLQYSTEVRPKQEGARLIERSRQDMESLASAAGADVRVRSVAGSSMHSLSTILLEVERLAIDLPELDLVIDISCMTRLHVARLCEWIIQSEHLLGSRSVYVQYSSPERYGSQNRQGRDAEARFDSTAPYAVGRVTRFNDDIDDVLAEPQPFAARGLILPGHESERLTEALRSLPVTRGVVLWIRRSQHRGDLTRAHAESGPIIDQRLGKKGWPRETFSVDEVVKVQAAVANFARSAGDDPVYIVPLGPKIVEVVALLALIPRVPEVWVSCPSPSSYSIRYSEGYSGTQLLRIQWRVSD